MSFASRRASLAGLQRRLAKFEARLGDHSNRNAPGWFDHWSRKAIGILNGEERGRIPIEFWDAIDVELVDRAPSRIVADNDD